MMKFPIYGKIKAMFQTTNQTSMMHTLEFAKKKETNLVPATATSNQLSGIHRQKRQGKLAGRVEVINGYATTIMWPLTTVFLHPHLGESGIIYIYIYEPTPELMESGEANSLFFLGFVFKAPASHNCFHFGVMEEPVLVIEEIVNAWATLEDS